MTRVTHGQVDVERDVPGRDYRPAMVRWLIILIVSLGSAGAAEANDCVGVTFGAKPALPAKPIVRGRIVEVRQAPTTKRTFEAALAAPRVVTVAVVARWDEHRRRRPVAKAERLVVTGPLPDARPCKPATVGDELLFVLDASDRFTTALTVDRAAELDAKKP